MGAPSGPSAGSPLAPSGSGGSEPRGGAEATEGGEGGAPEPRGGSPSAGATHGGGSGGRPDGGSAAQGGMGTVPQGGQPEGGSAPQGGAPQGGAPQGEAGQAGSAGATPSPCAGKPDWQCGACGDGVCQWEEHDGGSCATDCKMSSALTTADAYRPDPYDFSKCAYAAERGAAMSGSPASPWYLCVCGNPATFGVGSSLQSSVNAATCNVCPGRIDPSKKWVCNGVTL